jgi:methyl-accepting chemotaxis protein
VWATCARCCRCWTRRRTGAAQPQRASPAQTFSAHTQFIAALLELLSDVADASNLTLDPDIDTYYLMRAGVDVQPRLVEVLGQMRGAGNAALRSGALDHAQRDTIAGALAFAAMWEDELKSALKRAVRADAALTSEVKLEEALTHNDHFLRLVREQVLGEAPHGDAAAFVAQGTRAIGANYAGIDRSLTALDALRRTVGQVRAGAGEIDTASREVAAASMDLSRRTEESAAHLQRTAASMAQIGRTLNQSASSAGSASGLVGHNAQVAAQGSQVVDAVVQTMGIIQQSSHRIAEILGAIDGIAFQTNILSLSAAVEAARAGEAGSVEQVEGGSRIVGQAGETMGEIVRGANRIRSLIEDISLGAGEQSAGLGEVNQSLQRLDAMTQQNAALVEQTAAAAASLSTNAQRLSHEMAFFQLP